MEQSKYQALFYGELKTGHSQTMAMRALAGAYQKEDSFFESWFSNDKTVVKKEATLEEAEYIRDYLGDLGLVIQIEPLNLGSQVVADVEKETEQLLEDAFAKIQQTLKMFKGIQKRLKRLLFRFNLRLWQSECWHIYWTSLFV